MDTNKLDTYFIANKDKFPAEKIPLLKEKMATVDDSRYEVITSVELKDTTTMLLISIFLGELGVDRFMMGDIGMGILKLLTGGLCGILWIIDMIKISGRVREENFNKVMETLQ